MAEWLGFFSDYTIKEFEEPNEKARCLFWVKEVDTGKRNTTTYGNTYAVNQFEFFDKELNPMHYNKAGWVLSEISDNLFKNAFTDIHIKVKDPLGEIRTFRVRWGQEGVILAVKMVEKFAQFENWQNYDMAEESKEIKEKLGKANSQIEELNLLNEIFKETEFFKLASKEIELAQAGKTESDIHDILVQNGLSIEFKEHWLK